MLSFFKKIFTKKENVVTYTEKDSNVDVTFIPNLMYLMNLSLSEYLDFEEINNFK